MKKLLICLGGIIVVILVVAKLNNGNNSEFKVETKTTSATSIARSNDSTSKTKTTNSVAEDHDTNEGDGIPDADAWQVLKEPKSYKTLSGAENSNLDEDVFSDVETYMTKYLNALYTGIGSDDFKGIIDPSVMGVPRFSTIQIEYLGANKYGKSKILVDVGWTGIVDGTERTEHYNQTFEVKQLAGGDTQIKLIN